MKPIATLAGLKIGGKYPTRVMGVINISPESFYKGSVFTQSSALLKSAQAMVEQGADILDIGAMSTAPYLKTKISEDEETGRIHWTLKALRKKIKIPISVDTSRSGPARIGLEEGADIINDVTGLRADPSLAQIAKKAKGVILMAHPSGLKAQNGKPISATLQLLKQSLGIARKIGITENRIVLDPGIGFFRTSKIHWWKWDLAVLKDLDSLLSLKRPLLVGVSRKSFIGHLLGDKPASERLYGSLGITASAVMKGASLIRTHDVKETKEMLKLLEAGI